MIYKIANDYLEVEVNSLGAELWSLKDNEGKEYLWQGDEKSWKNRATNLFPFCGRMTNGIYTYQGKEYEMMIHGFAKVSEFAVLEQASEKLVLYIDSDASTLKVYPFAFRFLVCYELAGTVLRQTYIVENKEDKTMYFAVGGHPGFQVPIEGGTKFEEYKVTFEQKEVKQILLSEDYFMTENEVVCPEVKDGQMPLRHSLFDRDALILRETGKEIFIESEKAKTKIRVAFPDMTFLAIWHRPFTDAQFVCIEPWSSLPARQDVVEDLEQKKDLVSLAGGQKYQNTLEIEIIKG